MYNRQKNTTACYIGAGVAGSIEKMRVHICSGVANIGEKVF